MDNLDESKRAFHLGFQAMSVLITKYMQLLTRLMVMRRHRRFMLLETGRQRVNAVALALQATALLDGKSGIHRIRPGLVRCRTVWKKHRPSRWWEDTVLQEENFSDEDWLDTFRMTRKSFFALCELLEAHMQPGKGFIRADTVPTEKRVAVAVYKLSKCADYGVVGDLFGIHKSSVRTFLFKFCHALHQLRQTFIHLPTASEAREIAQRIQAEHCIPQICGAIDVTHIPISPPKESGHEFFNNNGWASFILQAVVDDKHMFRDISCRFPGSTDGMEVLIESHIYQHSDALPKEAVIVRGLEIPLMLVGDQTYPLLPWLVRPFGGDLSDEQKLFNEHLNSAKMLADATFAMLRSRWNILCTQIDIAHTVVPYIISACCCLHNFCEINQAPHFDHWGDVSADLQAKQRQPRDGENNVTDVSAVRCREILMSIVCDSVMGKPM